MKKLLCKLIGHVAHPDITDSGYTVCLRCYAHEYYQSPEWQYTWSILGKIVYPYFVIKNWIQKIYYNIKVKFDDEIPF